MEDPIRIGDWKREKELGSGGFGIVSLWINRNDGQCLAIKKCKWRLENQLTDKQRQRWTSEVEMMKDIKHDNIVGYRAMPETLEKGLLSSNPSKLPILSMEFCSFGSLRDMLMKPHNSCGFHETEVINVFKDMSNALKYLHSRNITHRDFKPENIVLQSCATRKSGIIYKVIDLGYAKELKSATVSFVGTLQYLAPEIFEKQTYNKNVDYWSLGITAFEIICGIRPFLPAYTPMRSLENVKKKDSDVICIQMTHTGDIKSSKELLKENHINMCLKQNIEKWLRSILQFDPEKRGLIENNNIDVFESLQNILAKKIITVFSVYTFEFYSYEINDSTLFSTLQDWIARDIKIQKADQYLVTSKKTNGTFALDYYDQANSNAMLFVFKKGAGISDHVSPALPKLIKVMFENVRTEFKFGTLRMLHAQVLYFISQEIRHLSALRNGIYFLYNNLRGAFVKQSKLFVDVRNFLLSLLSEIEFYNKIETSLFSKVYKDTNNVKLNAYLLEYEHYIHQLKEIIGTINAMAGRQKNVAKRNDMVHHSSAIVLNRLRVCDFKALTEQATERYEIVDKEKSIKIFTAGKEIVKIVSTTLKIRDNVVRDPFLLHYLKYATGYWKELNKLIFCMEAIQTHLNAIKENLQQNVIKRLNILQDFHKHKESNIGNLCGNDGASIIKENIALRYDMQEFIDSGIFKYKNASKENGAGSLGFTIENGIDL